MWTIADFKGKVFFGFIVVYDTKEKGVLYCPFHKTLQMYSISVRFYEMGDTRVCIVRIIGSTSKTTVEIANE